MAIPVAVMVDTIGSDATHIPAGIPDVGGYVSGTSDIIWTAGEWARFPNSKHVRIWQGFGTRPSITGFDVIDVEAGAVTVAEAAQAVRDRVAAGIHWTTLYGTDSTLAALSAAIQAEGHTVWDGHVNAWLADWNLSGTTAAAKLGTFIHGMSCVGVQWASPSSNPNTLIPGTKLTLKVANCDLSVVDAGWIPSGGFTDPNPPKPAPVPTTAHGVVVHLPDGGTRNVVSSDNGVTWH